MSDSTGMTVNQLIDALSKISKEHGDRTVAVYAEGWRGVTEINPPSEDDYFYPTLQTDDANELDVRFDW